MKHRTSIVATFAIALPLTMIASGCVDPDNPLYCEGHPGAAGCDAGTPDALPRCTSSDTCMAPTAVCEISSGACVQCTPTDAAACSGVAPVCGGENTCRACESHDECGSGACLPDGSCADEANVAYVDAAGTVNATCARATPCTRVADALATGRPLVKCTGTLDGAITINGTQAVTLLGAPDARLTRTTLGPLLRIEDAANVAIYDLEISGALGANVGISIPVATTVSLALTRAKVQNNAGGGISASSGTLAISQSTIANNAGGGI